MELGASSGRPTSMRLLGSAAAALFLPLLLAGCGSSDGGRATDPAGTTSSAPTTGPSTPTARPTVGSYPEFGPTDYTYQLTVQCFCAQAGTPVHVTVAGGKVVPTAVGTASPFQVTINDVIAAANNTTAYKVTVDWPAGQAYPSSVYVDRSKNMADEEIGYSIADVQVSS